MALCAGYDHWKQVKPKKFVLGYYRGRTNLLVVSPKLPRAPSSLVSRKRGAGAGVGIECLGGGVGIPLIVNRDSFD